MFEGEAHGVHEVVIADKIERMAAQCPAYSDGSPIAVGDELEVKYQELFGIPHRGLIHRIDFSNLGGWVFDIIHNSKVGGGVCVVTLPEFAQGHDVRLVRRPASIEHAQEIVRLAESMLGHTYHVGTANCEHFTDWCYRSGQQASSPGLQAGVAIASLACVIGLALTTDNSRS